MSKCTFNPKKEIPYCNATTCCRTENALSILIIFLVQLQQTKISERKLFLFSSMGSNEVVSESSNCVQSDSQLVDVSVFCSYHVVGDELGNSSSDQPSVSLKCYQPCNAYPMQLNNNLDEAQKQLN